MPILEMQSPYVAQAGPLPPSETGPIVLSLSFVQETEDGPPVSPTSVSLTSSAGREYGGMIEYPYGSTETATAEPVDKNKIMFRSLEPDLYQLHIVLADGQWSERLVSIRDEKPRELTIVCPSPRTKRAPVSMSIKPLPDWMQKKGFKIVMTVQAAPIEIGQAKWTTASLQTQGITFDAETGMPVAIAAITTRGAPELDLRDLPPEERRVFLPVGAVTSRFEVNERPDGLNPVRVYQWPESPGAEGGLRHVIEAHENTWELELPQKFLEEVARNVRGSEPPPIDLPPSDPVLDAAPDPAHDGARPAQPVSASDASERRRILDQLQGQWLIVDGSATTTDGDVVALKDVAMSFFFQGDTTFAANGKDRKDPSPFSIDVTNRVNANSRCDGAGCGDAHCAHLKLTR